MTAAVGHLGMAMPSTCATALTNFGLRAGAALLGRRAAQNAYGRSSSPEGDSGAWPESPTGADRRDRKPGQSELVGACHLGLGLRAAGEFAPCRNDGCCCAIRAPRKRDSERADGRDKGRLQSMHTANERL